VDTGIPQGSPLSPILYLFYNADLIEAEDSNVTLACTIKGGYIDDVGILVWGKDTRETIKKLVGIAGECEEWARKHASKFAVEKFELMHFVHKNDKKRFTHLDRPLTIPVPGKPGQYQTLKLKNKARYLGVILDPDLNWGEHMKHVEERATKSIAALQAISGSTWGVNRPYILKLYNAVVVPQITFAASVWWTPDKVQGEKTRRTKMLQVLNRIQKKALCVATGAFKSTALSVLEAETFTLPMEQQLLRHASMAAVRLCGSPLIDHALTRWSIRRATRKYPLTVRQSPLQRLQAKILRMVGYESWEGYFKHHEKFRHAVVPPWWEPPFIRIAPSKKQAVKEHDAIRRHKRKGELWIYTDGSDIKRRESDPDGNVGAAAWCEQKDWASKIYMGTSRHSTVYSAELMGLSEALALAWRAGPSTRKVIIFTNNQAAIRSAARPRMQSGQYILRKFVRNLEKLRKERGVKVEVRWIPAHIGVPGNEKADVLAKEASGYNSPRGDSVKPTLFKLKSACKRFLRAESVRQWRKNWPVATTGVSYRRHYGADPTSSIHDLYSDVCKAVSSIIIQLRTEKIGLKDYLYRIKQAESPKCECHTNYETVTHILGECPLYRRQRRRFFNHPVLRDVKTVLSEPRLAAKAANFILSTGLLDQFRYFKQSLINEREEDAENIDPNDID
jgi:ribonuclease HI